MRISRDLTQLSPKERAYKKSEVKVLSFGEDLGEAKIIVQINIYNSLNNYSPPAEKSGGPKCL
jgi:hypothetical protein